MIKRLIERYTLFLARTPYFARALQTGITFGVADIISQHLESHCSHIPSQQSPLCTATQKKREWEWDSPRTVRMTIWGCCFWAPFVTRWLGFLDKRIPGKTTLDVVKKTALDQTISGPLCNAALMVYSVLTTGGGWVEVEKKLSRDYWGVVKVMWSFWVPVHLVNFRLVTPFWRVPFVNVAVLCWSTFLCVKNARGTEDLASPTLRGSKDALVK